MRELTRQQEERREGLFFGFAVVLIFMLLVTALFGSIFVWKYVSPKVNLYRAGIENEIQVRDAEGKAQAAVSLAEAEVNRARGIAEANEIINASITDRYIDWLYVDQLDRIKGQIIYIPTEAGLPILEANRIAPTVAP